MKPVVLLVVLLSVTLLGGCQAPVGSTVTVTQTTTLPASKPTPSPSSTYVAFLVNQSKEAFAVYTTYVAAAAKAQRDANNELYGSPAWDRKIETAIWSADRANNETIRFMGLLNTTTFQPPSQATENLYSLTKQYWQAHHTFIVLNRDCNKAILHGDDGTGPECTKARNFNTDRIDADYEAEAQRAGNRY